MSDLDDLQGKWTVALLELDGSPIPASRIGGAHIVLAGDQFISTGMGATYEGTIELDTTTSPKTLKMIFSEGPERGNVNHGIYVLDDDTWTICLAINGGPAPRLFSTTENSNYALEILTRQGT